MAAKAGKGGSGKRGKNPAATIIRREEASSQAHHGGAWKVAYADFVTAMMAFFLLMWLLNATTEDQRKGLADYFSPSNLMSHNSSGTGQPFGGHTAFDEGALVSDRGSVQVTVGSRPIAAEPDEQDEAERPGGAGRSADDGDAGAALKAARAKSAQTSKAAPGLLEANRVAPVGPGANQEAAGSSGHKAGVDAKPAPAENTSKADAASREHREQQEFARAAEAISRAVRDDPALAALAKQLKIDITPEGLRIQLLDAERQPMFATGSAAPNEAARRLLLTIAPILTRLNHSISITGHTDAAPYPGPERTNWELSAERANAARRMLTEAGLPEARMTEVTGRADRELLLPDQPLAAANRRIAIVVLRDAPAGAAPPSTPTPQVAGP